MNKKFLVLEGYKINIVVHRLVFFGRYTDDTLRTGRIIQITERK
jgi:hypothetical protein